MPKAAEVAQSLGRYEVLGSLASGGMAEVLLARIRGPNGFERPVVIKRIFPHLGKDREFRQMFLEEAGIVARIRHKNVVAVNELGEIGGELCMVMEYLEGESLGTLVRRVRSAGASLPPALGAYVVAEACAGLHAAHELVGPDGSPMEVVHRDVSPQNVFVLYDGQVKVIDFGIAKAKTSEIRTQAGQIKGKYAYMAPEQCVAGPLDRRADIFALGIILQEITTGARLFDRENDVQILKAVCLDPIPRPSEQLPGYPPELEAICLRALAREPADRFATAAEMRGALLGAIRAITGDDLGERLAAEMRVRFGDRMQQKLEMLRRMEGAVAAPVARPEPQGPSHLAPEASPEQGSGTKVSLARGAGSAPERKRSPWLAALLVLGVAGSSVLAWRLATRAPAVADTGTGVVAAPAADEVELRFDSTPPGATVTIDGTARGKTPLALRLPRRDQPSTVIIEAPDHDAQTQPFTPDRDQSFSFALRAAAPPPAASVSAEVSAEPPPQVAPPAPPKPKPKPKIDRFD